MGSIKYYDSGSGTWKYAAQGPKGDTGDTGPQGPQGEQGPQGPAGSDGVGVPVGGTTGQVLAKASAADNDTEWVNQSTGSGDVVGPASSTDNALARYDGTTGKIVQDSSATLSDVGILSVSKITTDAIQSEFSDPVDFPNFLTTDDITESTLDNGVYVEGVLIKDGGITLTEDIKTDATFTTPLNILDGAGIKALEVWGKYGSTATAAWVWVQGTENDTAIIGAWGEATDVNLRLDTKGAGKVYVDDSGTSREVATISGTQTLTSKRITPRITNGGSGTITVNSNITDSVILANSGGAITFAAPTGTPTQSQKLLIRIKDDGTARAITWNAIYRPIGVTLPTTTTPNKLLYIGCVYNTTDTKWDVIAVTQEA